MIEEIRHRRIPQTLIGYAVGLWGGAQVIDFVEQRYGLSPHWLELFVVGYLLLVPAVIAIAWNKGAAGPQRWKRATLVTIALNVVVAGIVLGATFGGREFGSVVETVVVENEEGETETHVVARDAFRRTLTSSFPQTSRLDGEDHWRAMELLNLVETDLSQNQFLELRSAWAENERARRAGLADATRMPRPLVHEAARNHGSDAFLVGTLRTRELETEIDLQLVSTEDGTPIGSTTLNGTDLFEIADAASAWIRTTLELPTAGTEDRAVRDMTTESPEALREYTRGLAAFLLEADYEAAGAHLERAVELDPTCALAHLAHYQLLALQGRMDLALPSVDAAMQHAYRLSERTGFALRASYYGARSDIPKTLAVLEMWARLHPGDPSAHRMLAINYHVTGRSRDALASLDRLLELLPEDLAALKQKVDIASFVGELERAEQAAIRWTEIVPNEVAPWVALAEVQRDRATLDEAVATADRALLLDPTSVEARMLRADLYTRQGDLPRAESVLAEIAGDERSTFDQLGAMDDLMDLHMRRGRTDDALAILERWEALAPGVLPLGQLVIASSTMFHMYVADGRADVARARLDEMQSRLPAPLNGFVSIGRALVAIADEKPAEAMEAVEALEATIEATGVKILDWRAAYFRMRAHLLAGEIEAALATADRCEQLDPSARTIGRFRAEALRSRGDLDGALAAVDWQLAVDPTSPGTLSERGRVLAAAGRTTEAIEAYEAALTTWADADPDFEPALEARRELEALRRDT